MDVGKAFTFVTEDEEWLTKLGIGGLITLLSIFILPVFILMGYMIKTARNVMAGQEKPLPVWTNYGEMFMDGLNLFIASLVYSSPIILISCIGTVIAGGFASGAESGGSSEAVFGGLAAGTIAIVSCLTILAGLALFFIAPALSVQYIKYDSLSACFRFGEVIDIARNNIGNILIITMASFGANLLVSVAASLLSITICGPLVLAFFAYPWILALTGHLYGQMAIGTDKFTGMESF